MLFWQVLCRQKSIFMETNSMHGTKIRTFRMLRGYSQEFMADKLNITQSTYSRIENDEHKLTVDILKQVAEVLGISIADITSNEPIIIQNNASNQGTQIARNENFYSDQKELYTKMLSGKDAEIVRLVKQVEDLMKLLEKKK